MRAGGRHSLAARSRAGPRSWIGGAVLHQVSFPWCLRSWPSSAGVGVGRCLPAATQQPIHPCSMLAYPCCPHCLSVPVFHAVSADLNFSLTQHSHPWRDLQESHLPVVSPVVSISPLQSPKPFLTAPWSAQPELPDFSRAVISPKQVSKRQNPE